MADDSHRPPPDIVETYLAVTRTLAQAHELLGRLVVGREELKDAVAEYDDAAERIIEIAKPERIPRSVIAQWNTYPGFRDDMRERERRVQRHVEGVVSPISLANQSGGDSLKSIERRMRHYCLDPRKDWPPSTWPEDEPKPKPFPVSGHQLAALFLSLSSVGLMDYLSDGQFDLVISFGKLVCHHFAGQV